MTSVAGAGYIGSDPFRVEQLGVALMAGAELLEDIRARLTGALYKSTWEGRDALIARIDWSCSSAPALGITAETLRSMGRLAFTHARLQIEASQADGSHSGGGGFYRTPHGVAVPPSDDGGLDLRGLLTGLGIAVVLAEIGEVLVENLTVLASLRPFVQGLGHTIPILSTVLGTLQLGENILEGDAGGIILTGGALVLGITAVAIAGTTLAPFVALAGIGLSIAAESPAITNWVGDRWSDAVDFGGGVVNGLATEAHAALDVTAEAVGNVVTGVVDGVQDVASGAVQFGQSVFEFVF